MRCYIVLGMVVTITLAVMADPDEWKRFGNGFHMGFGKRGDDSEAIDSRIGGLHMGFKRFSIDPMESQEFDKRYNDGHHFQMGFGKRGNSPFASNFHMGFGKRAAHSLATSTWDSESEPVAPLPTTSIWDLASDNVDNQFPDFHRATQPSNNYNANIVASICKVCKM
uniref:Conserved secreted protein n=1 Tax=Panagrellus redivivus TaxID=6233 RepID=A0A7E4ZZ99_PANRE